MCDQAESMLMNLKHLIGGGRDAVRVGYRALTVAICLLCLLSHLKISSIAASSP